MNRSNSGMTMLFFDLDGTLTDPAPGIAASIRYAVQALGGRHESEQDLTRFIGPPLREAFREILATDDDALIERAVEKYRERFVEQGLYENAVYPGIPTALEALGRAGFQLRVVTSKPAVYAERIVDHFGLRAHFPAVYGSELSGERSHKAELIAFALRAEGLAAEAVCMIGDRRQDIEGARVNDLRAVGVLWGYGDRAELETAGADCLVEVIDDLPPAIGTLGARQTR